MITSMNGCQGELYRPRDQQRLGCNDSRHRLEAEVSAPHLPVVGDFHKDGSRQTDGRRAVGKDPNYISAPLDLFVEPFLGIGGVNTRPELGWKGQVGQDVVFGLCQDLGRLWPAWSQALPPSTHRPPGRRPIRLSEDGAQGSRHDRLVAAGHVGQQVSHTCACTAGASVKCTRQRCQLTLARTWSKAAFRPSWASLVTSCTPFRPRRTKLRRKSTQKASSSVAPRAKPSPPRSPLSRTPVAKTSAWLRIRWLGRNLR